MASHSPKEHLAASWPWVRPWDGQGLWELFGTQTLTDHPALPYTSPGKSALRAGTQARACQTPASPTSTMTWSRKLSSLAVFDNTIKAPRRHSFPQGPHLQSLLTHPTHTAQQLTLPSPSGEGT